MTHKGAPPETTSQTDCREWWSKAQPHIHRAWGRDKHGAFLAEESRILHLAWLAAAADPIEALKCARDELSDLNSAYGAESVDHVIDRCDASIARVEDGA